MSKKIKSNIDDALFNFYLEADKSIINEALKEDIEDLNEYTKKKKQLIFLAKAKANKQHDENLLNLANKLQEAINRNLDRPIAILKQLIQDKGSPALYNNLNKLSKQDIVEIIKGTNLVQLLEQLDQNEKDH